MDPSAAQLIERLRRRDARVGVIGLGYVGLPLAVEFARVGFRVTGIDLDAAKVDAINRGESYIPDVTTAELQAVVKGGGLLATTEFSVLAALDTVNICVPTPLRKTKDPDLSYIVGAVEEIAKYLHRGQLVILESTTYPGTTDEVVQPMLEAGGLKAGRDFYLAFSPERVDPGNPEWNTANIPKVIGGLDETSTAVASVLYEQIVDRLVPVSSTRVAEMVKLLENTFRAVNIGLVNELALMCHDLDVDVWEVIDAASSKPFGFMPFYPGPGLGGHCIPIDPHFLSWKARQNGFESRFIELAGHVNATMPRFVIERVVEALNSRSQPIRGSRVHLFGMAYKPNVGDARESPAIDIAQLLTRRGAIVSYSDPYVPSVTIRLKPAPSVHPSTLREPHGRPEQGRGATSSGRTVEGPDTGAEGDMRLEAVPFDAALAGGMDCAVITTHHKCFDYAAIAARAPLVVDTRNALKGVTGSHIFRL